MFKGPDYPACLMRAAGLPFAISHRPSGIQEYR